MILYMACGVGHKTAEKLSYLKPPVLSVERTTEVPKVDSGGSKTTSKFSSWWVFQLQP